MGFGAVIRAIRASAGGTVRRVRRALVALRYDAAQTHNGNVNHWAAADGLSANASLRPGVRRTLRNRARYEIHNSSLVIGMISTLANNTIGTGPRLQLATPASFNRTDIQQVETRFHEWATTVNLAQKLRIARFSKAVDGEAFALLGTNDGLDCPVKLDLRLIEADQVASPMLGLETPTKIDGIEYDQQGNPIRYDVLRQHPGDSGIVTAASQADVFDAKYVLHYFRPLRPGQGRGVPEVAPALEVMALKRRYELAVVRTAERQASYTGVLETNAPADGLSAAISAGDTYELNHGELTAMPEGYSLKAFDPSQPSATFCEASKEFTKLIARCINMPLNIAAGDSSNYNYASGRLDNQNYWQAIRVERTDLENDILRRVFAAWFKEAVLISGYLPRSIRANLKPVARWLWDGQPHVDPVKEASAQETRLRNGTSTLVDEWAENNQDPEEMYAKLAEQGRRVAELEKAGVRLGFMQATPGAAPNPAATDAIDQPAEGAVA